jgi:hypothetical protein
MIQANKIDPLSMALDNISIASCHLLEKDISRSLPYIDKSIFDLYKINRQDYLPIALLIRANLYRCIQKYLQSHTDLQEVYDIAKPSGMRLHLTDYHLEMARLLIAEGKAPTSEVKEHVDHAEKLINDTGYHRRDKELEDIKEQLKALL